MPPGIGPPGYFQPQKGKKIETLVAESRARTASAAAPPAPEQDEVVSPPVTTDGPAPPAPAGAPSTTARDPDRWSKLWKQMDELRETYRGYAEHGVPDTRSKITKIGHALLSMSSPGAAANVTRLRQLQAQAHMKAYQSEMSLTLQSLRTVAGGPSAQDDIAHRIALRDTYMAGGQVADEDGQIKTTDALALEMERVMGEKLQRDKDQVLFSTLLKQKAGMPKESRAYRFGIPMMPGPGGTPIPDIPEFVRLMSEAAKAEAIEAPRRELEEILEKLALDAEIAPVYTTGEGGALEMDLEATQKAITTANDRQQRDEGRQAVVDADNQILAYHRYPTPMNFDGTQDVKETRRMVIVFSSEGRIRGEMKRVQTSQDDLEKKLMQANKVLDPLPRDKKTGEPKVLGKRQIRALADQSALAEQIQETQFRLELLEQALSPELRPQIEEPEPTPDAAGINPEFAFSALGGGGERVAPAAPGSEFDQATLPGWAQRAINEPLSIKNDDGSESSVRTESRAEKGEDGNFESLVYPTIRKIGGKLVRLESDAAYQYALERNDFVRFPGGPTYEDPATQDAERKAKEWSTGFSDYLGSAEVRGRKEERTEIAESFKEELGRDPTDEEIRELLEALNAPAP